MLFYAYAGDVPGDAVYAPGLPTAPMQAASTTSVAAQTACAHTAHAGHNGTASAVAQSDSVRRVAAHTAGSQHSDVSSVNPGAFGIAHPGLIKDGTACLHCSVPSSLALHAHH